MNLERERGQKAPAVGSVPARAPRPPRRVVSLVPSLTESLFDLGLGASLVGITDYCVRPAHAAQALPRVGGTKNPLVDRIVALQPDLVLANQEENTPEALGELQAGGLAVWVSFPRTVAAALEVLRELAALFQSSQALMQVHSLEVAVEYASSAALEQSPVRLFCPIWQGETGEGSPWWMTFNQDTYAHDLLRLVGGQNAFGERVRRYPLEAEWGRVPAQPPQGRDTRYPRVDAAEVLEAAPDLILLPDEPFAFDISHKQELARWLAPTPAVKEGRVHLVDGSLITWHGTRLASALRELPGLISSESA